MNTPAQDLNTLLNSQPHGIAALEAMVGAPLPTIDSLQIIGSNLADTAQDELGDPGYILDDEIEKIENDYLDAVPDLYDYLYGNDCQAVR